MTVSRRGAAASRSLSCSAPALLVASLLTVACAEGGDEDRPESEVLVQASHHLFALLSVAEFSEFPLNPGEAGFDRGILVMQDDGRYRVSRDGQTSDTDDYALEESGALSIFVNQGARRPIIRFSGAYGLQGDTGRYYFTDRFSTTEAPAIGLFWGTRIVSGAPNLEGAWHVFSQHLIYGTASSLLDPNNVGRTLGGRLSIDSAGMVAGVGVQSGGVNVDLSGTAQGFADSRADLNLVYADPQVTDTRAFFCGVDRNLMLGVDEDEADGESGLIALVRHRTTAADRSALAGTYHLGVHTVFVSPSRPGTDVAQGTLTFNATGGFSLEAVGADGESFSYSGTYLLADDGALSLSVPGTNENWRGAVDQDYRTVVVADAFIEDRTAPKPPELNLFFGIREVPAPVTPALVPGEASGAAPDAPR
ncbi:MAG: hypothetical protein AAF628_03930 [Planctomycetota bacterium]